MSEQSGKFITVQVGYVIIQCLQLWSDTEWLPSIFGKYQNSDFFLGVGLEWM